MGNRTPSIKPRTNQSDQQGHQLRRGPRSGRLPKFDAIKYKGRNVIERGYARLKQWRGLATRYDKLAVVYRPAVVLNGVIAWLQHLSDALDERTVVVSDTDSAGIDLPQLARALAQTRTSRDEVLTRIEELVQSHPLHGLLTSMPAVGVRTAARILTEVVGKDFVTAGHLASYAGLAPVTWRSGTSIRGDHSSRRGNKVLNRALFLSAFAALKDPLSRAYYDRKSAQGKKHNQVLIALARRRCNVLFAMLRDGVYYHPPAGAAAA